jgi:hypothetical protein
MPYAIPIHCIAHKEALAAKDVTGFLADSVDVLMKQVYSYFCNSSKRNALYSALLEGLENDDIPEISKLHEVRWLSRGKALDSFLRNIAPLQHFFSIPRSKESAESEKEKTIKSTLTSGIIVGSAIFLHDIIFSKLNSLNTYLQRSKLTPFEAHKHYSAVVKSIEDEYLNDECQQYYLRSNKLIAIFLMHEISAGRKEFVFGKSEALKEMFILPAKHVDESISICDNWGCNLTLSMNDLEFVRITEFISHYSISLVEALRKRLRYERLEKFYALDIAYFRSQELDRNAVRDYLLSVSAEYGNPKKIKPIDLSKHPSWKEANAAEQDIREAARLANEFLKINDIEDMENTRTTAADPVSVSADVTENAESTEINIGYYASIFSKPTITSASIEAEIEEFITFMHSNRFMSVPNSDPPKFMDAYEFYEYNSTILNENFALLQ